MTTRNPLSIVDHLANGTAPCEAVGPHCERIVTDPARVEAVLAEDYSNFPYCPPCRIDAHADSVQDEPVQGPVPAGAPWWWRVRFTTPGTPIVVEAPDWSTAADRAERCCPGKIAGEVAPILPLPRGAYVLTADLTVLTDDSDRERVVLPAGDHVEVIGFRSDDEPAMLTGVAVLTWFGCAFVVHMSAMRERAEPAVAPSRAEQTVDDLLDELRAGRPHDLIASDTGRIALVERARGRLLACAMSPQIAYVESPAESLRTIAEQLDRLDARVQAGTLTGRLYMPRAEGDD